MPKKSGKPRRRGKVLKAKIINSIALGTLSNATVISDPVPDSVDERAFALSTELLVSTRGMTPGEGPIIVGVAHSDYTTAEIQEWIDNTGGWSEGDLVQQEISKRKIREIGQFPVTSAAEVLNDGRPIKVPLRFYLTQGQTLDCWALNRSGSTLTTGGVVLYDGHAWLKPT